MGREAAEGMMTKSKRFALLMAARDSDYVRKMYGGYYRVFVEAFGEGAGERWDMFRVVDGEFPSDEDLRGYDGFVVSGSPSDAYGSDPWVVKLCRLLRRLDAMQKRVLGICFGHQVLCRALGGKVRKAPGGWDIGVRKVNIVSKYFDGLEVVPTSASIIEIHQDEVWEVPGGAEVIASSEKTGVEMFRVGGHILGIQGHPEYSKDILCSIIDRLANNNTLESGFAEETKARMESCEPDSQFWQTACRNFLKGRYLIATHT